MSLSEALRSQEGSLSVLIIHRESESCTDPLPPASIVVVICRAGIAFPGWEWLGSVWPCIGEDIPDGSPERGRG